MSVFVKCPGLPLNVMFAKSPLISHFSHRLGRVTGPPVPLSPPWWGCCAHFSLTGVALAPPKHPESSVLSCLISTVSNGKKMSIQEINKLVPVTQRPSGRAKLQVQALLNKYSTLF